MKPRLKMLFVLGFPSPGLMNTIYPEVYPDVQPLQTFQMLGTENTNRRY